MNTLGAVIPVRAMTPRIPLFEVPSFGVLGVGGTVDCGGVDGGVLGGVFGGVFGGTSGVPGGVPGLFTFALTSTRQSQRGFGSSVDPLNPTGKVMSSGTDCLYAPCGFFGTTSFTKYSPTSRPWK